MSAWPRRRGRRFLDRTRSEPTFRLDRRGGGGEIPHDLTVDLRGGIGAADSQELGSRPQLGLSPALLVPHDLLGLLRLGSRQLEQRVVARPRVERVGDWPALLDALVFDVQEDRRMQAFLARDLGPAASPEIAIDGLAMLKILRRVYSWLAERVPPSGFIGREHPHVMQVLVNAMSIGLFHDVIMRFWCLQNKADRRGDRHSPDDSKPDTNHCPSQPHLGSLKKLAVQGKL